MKRTLTRTVVVLALATLAACNSSQSGDSNVDNQGDQPTTPPTSTGPR